MNKLDIVNKYIEDVDDIESNLPSQKATSKEDILDKYLSEDTEKSEKTTDKEDSLKQTLIDMANLAASGATFEFKDEIAGALAAYSDYMKGKSKEEILKTYRDVKEKVKQSDIEARERSPIAGAVGEIIGSLAVPLPVPSKIKAVEKLLDIGKMVPESYLAKALGHTAKGVVSGAEIGAIMGAGMSEKSPFTSQESTDQFIKDIIESAKMGGQFGGIIGGVAGTALPAAQGLVKSVTKGKTPKPIEASKVVFEAERQAEKQAKPELGILGRYEESRADAIKFMDKALKELEDFKKAKMGEVKEKAANKLFDTRDELINAKAALSNLADDPIRNQLLKDIDMTLGLIERNIVESKLVPVSKSASKLEEKLALKKAEQKFLEKQGETPSKIFKEITETESPTETKLGIVAKETPTRTKIVSKEPILFEEPLMKEQKFTFAKKIDESQMTESQLDQFIKENLDPIIYDPKVTKRTRDIAANLKESLRKKVDIEVPGYSESYKTYSGISSIEDVLAGKEFSGQMRTAAEKADFLSAMANRIEKSRDLKDAKEGIEMALNGFEFQGKRIPGLRDFNPKLAEIYENTINKLGERLEYSKEFLEEIKRTTNVLFTLYGGIQSVISHAAGVAGRLTGSLERSIGKEIQTAKSITSKLLEKGSGILNKMSEQEAQQLVDKGFQKFGDSFKSIGNTLINLAKMPERRRQAYIYQLMTNPSAKEMLSSLFNTQDQE